MTIDEVPTEKIERRKRYVDYIDSEDWKKKREEVIEKSEGCYICKRQYESGFHVHHLTYRNLKNEPQYELVLVCQKDHALIHRYQRYRRCSIWEATETIKNFYPRQPPMYQKPYRGKKRTWY